MGGLLAGYNFGSPEYGNAGAGGLFPEPGGIVEIPQTGYTGARPGTGYGGRGGGITASGADPRGGGLMGFGGAGAFFGTTAPSGIFGAGAGPTAIPTRWGQSNGQTGAWNGVSGGGGLASGVGNYGFSGFSGGGYNGYGGAGGLLASFRARAGY